MKRLLILLLVMTTNSLVFGQFKPEQTIKKFFETYADNKPEEALENLYRSSPWITANSDGLINMKNKFGDIKDVLGEYNGYELLVKKSLGDCFEHYTYLVRYDRQPVRFKFEFYKPRDGWIIYSFAYDYDLDDELEEAARLKLLNQK